MIVVQHSVEQHPLDASAFGSTSHPEAAHEQTQNGKLEITKAKIKDSTELTLASRHPVHRFVLLRFIGF
jgi:hypothetical protein